MRFADPGGRRDRGPAVAEDVAGHGRRPGSEGRRLRRRGGRLVSPRRLGAGGGLVRPRGGGTGPLGGSVGGRARPERARASGGGAGGVDVEVELVGVEGGGGGGAGGGGAVAGVRVHGGRPTGDLRREGGGAFPSKLPFGHLVEWKLRWEHDDW
jgi:hypothetical protein